MERDNREQTECTGCGTISLQPSNVPGPVKVDHCPHCPSMENSLLEARYHATECRELLIKAQGQSLDSAQRMEISEIRGALHSAMVRIDALIDADTMIQLADDN